VRAFLDDLRAVIAPSEARARPQALSARALGLFVEVRLPEDPSGVLDEDLLAQVVDALDDAAATLRAAGFLLPLETGSALLGARLLLGADEDERKALEGAARLVRELAASLSVMPAKNPGVRASACLHLDSALARVVGDEHVIVGGPLLNIAAWAPQEPIAAASATREAALAAGLPLEATARYVALD